jgi:hypothetical protein
MGKVMLSLNDKEKMDLEAIIVDRDRDEALRFILKVLEPKPRAKGKGAPDTKKGMGISG